MRRRATVPLLGRVLVVVLAAFALGGAGATAALAEDLPDPITPPGVTAPPDGGENEVPPGPTYVITPGTGGSELGDPADPAEVEKAREADAARSAGTGKKPTGTTKGSGTKVAGPRTPSLEPGAQVAAVDVPLGPWWTVGSGALLLLVLADLGRTAARRRTRRTA